MMTRTARIRLSRLAAALVPGTRHAAGEAAGNGGDLRLFPADSPGG
jgi:hypothetical protein